MAKKKTLPAYPGLSASYQCPKCQVQGTYADFTCEYVASGKSEQLDWTCTKCGCGWATQCADAAPPTA